MKAAIPALLIALAGLTAVIIAIGNGDDDLVEASSTAPTTTITDETTTTTTSTTTTTVVEEAADTAPPPTIAADVAEQADEDDVVLSPELTMDVEVAQLGETFIRYRFRSSEPTAYTAVVKTLEGEVINTEEGLLAPEEIITERVEGLEPGTVYIAQATLVGPCLLYTSPSPRDRTRSRMPSSA